MVTRVIAAHTGELASDELGAIRVLLDAAFDGRFDDHDWEHSLGGMHALVLEGDDKVIAHGSLVQRRLLHEGRSLRTGYVEGVATRADRRRAGHGSTVMTALERLAPAYDVLALSASAAAVPFYEARGWTVWRGASSVLSPEGLLPTPDDDGAIYVLGGAGLDLDEPLICDWRNGDVW
ncbi:MAG: GNAT family N-acetyltransferase [Nocardioides sp.]